MDDTDGTVSCWKFVEKNPRLYPFAYLLSKGKRLNSSGNNIDKQLPDLGKCLHVLNEIHCVPMCTTFARLPGTLPSLNKL